MEEEITGGEPEVFEYVAEVDGVPFNVYTTHDRSNGPLYVTKLVRTCHGCPAQWDAILADGQELYLRYRWGGLTVSYGVFGKLLLSASNTKSGWEGTLSADQLQQVVFNVLHLCEEV